MPKLMTWRGWGFFFYSREGLPPEPPHVHVRKDRSEAKFWLTPVVRVAGARRVDPRMLKVLTQVVVEHRDAFEEQWHGFFSGADRR